MLRAEPDAEVPNDTYFWSVTYSVAANARKLAHPILQKLETAPLIVVTPIFDYSDGLQRTIASVARNGYSNVAHVLIDRCQADGPLDLKEGGRSDFAIGESAQDGGSFADLMKEMPNPFFIELPCGEELAPRTFLEIMLAVESAEPRVHTGMNEGSEVIQLPAGVGLGSKGDQLTVFRKAEWMEDRSRAKVVTRP
jgi:hypothetical protein